MPKSKRRQKQLSAQGHDRGRRDVIKAVVAGGGVAASAFALPSRWTKPIVETIVVPAHASVSPALTTTAILTTSSPM